MRRARDGLGDGAAAAATTGFERFVAEQGAALRAVCDVLRAVPSGSARGWHGWPAEPAPPGRAGGRARAARDRQTADRIRFHEWVQYQLDRQLGRASAVLPVMQDLPIGFDADGADGWAFQDVLAHGISVGAPPDEFNTRGQDWGLPPFVPGKLRAAGYEPFVADDPRLPAPCRRAAHRSRDGAVPAVLDPGRAWSRRTAPTSARHASDLLAIVALESQRARAVIVGEDLGTVEEATRAELAARRILSYRLLWFEKTPPSRFPEQRSARSRRTTCRRSPGCGPDRDLEAQRALKLAPNEAGTREIHDRVAGDDPAPPRDAGVRR